MKHLTTITLKLVIAAMTITLISCEININADNDCLECTYTTDGRVVTEELCDTYGTEEEKEAMRERLQIEADALDVNLTCKKH